MPSTTDPQREPSSSPIHSENNDDPESKRLKNSKNVEEISKKSENVDENSKDNGNDRDSNLGVRRARPSRACTQRAVQRMQQAAAAEAAMAAAEKKRKSGKSKRKERLVKLLKEVEVEEDEEEEEHSRGSDEEGEEDGGTSLSSRQQCSGSKVITPLVGEPEPSQLPRWKIRSMWQLASILNFFNVFRHLLNIKVEFSAEEFETALLTPNRTLGDIHMPLLKAIPPVTRTALGPNTWITVLCRKLRDWWHWVAEGELPIVASQGAEIEAYNSLDPGVRVVILKALCDIRVEQEDIRSYIDNSIKQGVHLSTFRKERIGGDSRGISYWYEDDPEIGHRLYREIRKVEVKRGKGKNVPPIPNSSFQWEAVGTNFDELQEVSEKLFSSKNRTEASLGKKLKNDMLPEIEKVHKRKERMLKKQHRQALMLDNMINVDGLVAGRSLRDRKPVTYTFDDYDRSINEALKETKKKQMSPDPAVRRDFMGHEVATNGGGGPSQFSRHSFSRNSPKSPDSDEFGDDHKFDPSGRSNRRSRRRRDYSFEEYAAVSDNDGEFDSDDDVVGEVVYDDEYMSRKRGRKSSSSSEGDEEYKWDDENLEDEEEEEEEEEEENDSSSASEESDRPRKFKKLSGRTRRGTKLRSVDELQSGLRRSKRATRNRINYQNYEWSESENELPKSEKSNGSPEHSHESDDADVSMESQDVDENHENTDMKVDQTVEEHPEMPKKKQDNPPEKSNSPSQNEVEGVKKRRFLDLNELAPGSGFDDGPDPDERDTDDF